MQSTYSQINIIVILVLVVTLVIIHSANSQSDIYQYGEKRQDSSTNRYCGKQLANALQMVCNGNYNPMFKKSGQEIKGINADYPYSYDYPLRSRASANAMMGRFGDARFRRQSRGVYDECCVKACSLQELMSYCGN